MKSFRINTAEIRKHIPEIRFGDEVLLSGTVYTARDAAHKRLVALIDEGKDLPFE